MITISGEEIPEHISYSSLTDWLSCGYKYYLAKVKQVKEVPAWWLFGGIAVHKAAEIYDFNKWNEDHDKS